MGLSPSTPGRYRKDFLSLSPASDSIIPPGKYHPHGCNVWLSPPSYSILLPGTVAGYRTPASVFRIPYAVRFSEAVPSLPVFLLPSDKTLPDHRSSLRRSATLSDGNDQRQSPDRTTSDPYPWNPAALYLRVLISVRCIWYSHRKSTLPARR